MLRIDGQLLLNTSEMPELQLLDIIINGEPAQNKLYSHPAAISVPWDSNITIRIMSKEEDIFRKKSLPLPDRGAERPVYRIVPAGIGNPVITAGQLQNYGFMHSERR